MNQSIQLMIFLIIKHFLADFPLQTPYMLGKGKKGVSWILPLAAHAGAHAAFTFAIFLFYKPHHALFLAVIDFIAHFLIDRIKASPLLGGRFKPTESYFWWALGADQMAHSLTYVALILLSQGGL